jgi:hypothetical protein
MAEPAQWTVTPDTPQDIAAVARQCRRLVTKRALLAAGAAAVPVPGVDWLTDVAVPLKLIPEFNAKFGLTPARSNTSRRTGRWWCSRPPRPAAAC